MIRPKIGVKFCGGCSAKFDRVELLGRIRNALVDSWEFVSWEDRSAEHVLIIAGCETACVDPEPFQHQTVHWVKSEAEEGPTIDLLRRIH